MSTDARRKRRLLIVGGVLLVAVVAVAIAIAAGSGGGSSDKTASTPASATSSSSAKAAASEFAGIPQKGNVLGSPSAPATMMIFADLQCPFCAEFENNALPPIVKKYVKTGKLKLVFQPIVILGNDSILGARASAAAAQQNKMYDFNAQLYRNQGQENSGYLNNGFVKKIATGAGLDSAKLIADLKAAPVNKLLNDAQSVATSGHVNSTPSFFISKKGGTLQQLPVTSLDAQAFYGELDKLTG
jgi:protein-disulfide isomerase